MTMLRIELKVKVLGEVFTVSVAGERGDWEETWYVEKAVDSKGVTLEDNEIWYNNLPHLNAIHDAMIEYFND